MDSHQEHKHSSSNREERLKQFQAAARAIGEELETLGLSEEDVLAAFEETREQVYREKYDSPLPDEESQG